MRYTREHKLIVSEDMARIMKQNGFDWFTDYQYLKDELVRLYKQNDHGEHYVAAPYAIDALLWFAAQYDILGVFDFKYNKFYFKIHLMKKNMTIKTGKSFYSLNDCMEELLKQIIKLF